MKTNEKRVREAIDKYNKSKDRRKSEIKNEPSSVKRFFMWCWYLTTWPFRWAWMEIHDITFFIIFIVVFLVVSSSVWGGYLLGFIIWGNETARNWCFGIASASWLFWLGPFTPFTQIVIFISIGIKAVVDLIRTNGNKKRTD
ncbi:MAG: hypothetical protein MJ238_03075 [Bacilli bacterium]|nr:hypothetical protein [Bacilli bacterium]